MRERQKMFPFRQKYSHFEKIGDNFLYFSPNFPMIFVSVSNSTIAELTYFELSHICANVPIPLKLP